MVCHLTLIYPIKQEKKGDSPVAWLELFSLRQEEGSGIPHLVSVSPLPTPPSNPTLPPTCPDLQRSEFFPHILDHLQHR